MFLRCPISRHTHPTISLEWILDVVNWRKSSNLKLFAKNIWHGFQQGKVFCHSYDSIPTPMHPVIGSGMSDQSFSVRQKKNSCSHFWQEKINLTSYWLVWSFDRKKQTIVLLSQFVWFEITCWHSITQMLIDFWILNIYICPTEQISCRFLSSGLPKYFW